MTDVFDPYHKWLGIPPKDQPPNHYRLLGIEVFESDPQVIELAADRQMTHIRTFQAGPHSEASQKLLNEIAAARVCLLNPTRKAAYDGMLRESLAVQDPVRSAASPLASMPIPGSPPPQSAKVPRPVISSRPIAVAHPAVIGPLTSAVSGKRRSSRQRRPRPIWQQPAVIGSICSALLVLAAVYALNSREVRAPIGHRPVEPTPAKPVGPRSIEQPLPSRGSTSAEPPPTVPLPAPTAPPIAGEKQSASPMSPDGTVRSAEAPETPNAPEPSPEPASGSRAETADPVPQPKVDTDLHAPLPISTITNSLGMTLALIPSGEFQMGSTPADIERMTQFDASLTKDSCREEQPQHRVRIPKPFYLGIHEVTVGQFAQFVQAGYKTEAERDGKGGRGFNNSKRRFEGYDPKYTWRSTGFPQDDRYPVVNVTWTDAVAFCEWLGRKEKHKYRLPTEAEWEYACRAGTGTLYYHGDDPEGLPQVANVADGTAKANLKFEKWETIAAQDGFVFSAPVGSFQPNAFGLYDMHGNVWEWCADWLDTGYYRRSPLVNPQGPQSGSHRVLRGGCWFFYGRACRSAGRGKFAPGERDFSIGFRVAADVGT
jgi:formylglycine-generating enzyme required for sulfatase activity